MGCVRLESVEYKGQYIGIKDNGEILPPSEVGTGIESMFQVIPVSILTLLHGTIIANCLFYSIVLVIQLKFE